VREINPEVYETHARDGFYGGHLHNIGTSERYLSLDYPRLGLQLPGLDFANNALDALHTAWHLRQC